MTYLAYLSVAAASAVRRDPTILQALTLVQARVMGGARDVEILKAAKAWLEGQRADPGLR